MSNNPENRLKDSASPYLRSAAHQPIDWYEWGPAAFDRAKAEDKPMLLDIGAVWCHWCHVIDRESYENPAIAKIISDNFIAVKVDRDERPDVDSRYQSAISSISGQGGWPLTGFLLPDGRPFFGGTYFPPEDQMGRPGFRRLLLAVAESYRSKRPELERAANSLADAVAQAEVFTGARGEFDPAVIDTQIASITQLVRHQKWRLRARPKFPHASAMDLVLDRFQQTGEQHLRAMAETTLEKMARGGVYDQLAGGFHRYSVDERWLVPHFEKMSYDNSELLRNYLHGWQVTQNPLLRQTAEGIIAWVNEVLSDQENGGFYASQDADYSLDDDGDYFTWTLDELRAALSPDEARVMELYYDVEAQGEMHHNPAKNVLWIAREPADIASQFGLEESAVSATIAAAKAKMLAARLPRPTPFVDKTMYVSLERHVCLRVSRRRSRPGWRSRRNVAPLCSQDSRPHARRSLEPKRAASLTVLAAPRSMARSMIRFLACSRYSTPTKPPSNRAISTPRKKPWTSPSRDTATPKAADFSIALATPLPWAASTSAASLFRIRPRPAPIPSRPSR